MNVRDELLHIAYLQLSPEIVPSLLFHLSPSLQRNVFLDPAPFHYIKGQSTRLCTGDDNRKGYSLFPFIDGGQSLLLIKLLSPVSLSRQYCAHRVLNLSCVKSVLDTDVSDP